MWVSASDEERVQMWVFAFSQEKTDVGFRVWSETYEARTLPWCWGSVAGL